MLCWLTGVLLLVIMSIFAGQFVVPKYTSRITYYILQNFVLKKKKKIICKSEAPNFFVDFCRNFADRTLWKSRRMENTEKSISWANMTRFSLNMVIFQTHKSVSWILISVNLPIMYHKSESVYGRWKRKLNEFGTWFPFIV